jgi:hypothetical protein
MKTNSPITAEFLQTVQAALAQLKRQLQRDYERAYPALREIIHLVLDEEETEAWKLSPFPHLLFPDLVEAHLTGLTLQPVAPRHEAVTESRERAEFPTSEPAFAFCG